MLVARRFDTTRGELTGDPVTLAPSIGPDSGTFFGFSASATGVLAHRAGSGALGRLTWFDRKGNILERGRDLNAPDLSPDEHFLAYDRTVNNNRDVWVLDLKRGPLTPFTRHSAVDGFPIWSPDGLRIAFHSQRNDTFDIWIKPVHGALDTEEFLYGTAENEWPLDWSGKNHFLLYTRRDQNYTSSDLLALPMMGDDRTPVVVADTRFEERMGKFSPDGCWIAYETDESGRFEIVVQAFPKPGRIERVSTNGGIAPRWSVDGREIYFIAPDGKMMAVPVTTSCSTFNPGKPEQLFPTHIAQGPFTFSYTVSRDGRFLINNRQVEEASVSPITLIFNWKP